MSLARLVVTAVLVAGDQLSHSIEARYGHQQMHTLPG
jgi:hypothetical protein